MEHEKIRPGWITFYAKIDDNGVIVEVPDCNYDCIINIPKIDLSSEVLQKIKELSETPEEDTMWI